MNDAQPLHIDLPGAYRVAPRLLAGPYPCAVDLPTAQRRVAALLDIGVDVIVDLTEPGEYDLRPYWPLLLEQAVLRGCKVEHWNSPIPDMGTPSVAQMQAILAHINSALQAGQTVYVHCFGGVGRTGVVIGCYLVQQGMSGDEALATIARLRKELPNAHRASPETWAQCEMVRRWSQRRSLCDD